MYRKWFLTLGLILAIQTSAIGQAPPSAPHGIRFPAVESPTAPPPAPNAVQPLGSDKYYVIDSDEECFFRTTPAGLLTISVETGPFKLPSKMLVEGGKAKFKEFKGKYVYIVEAAGNGQAELFTIPKGVDADNKIIQKSILASKDGSNPDPIKTVTVPKLIGSSQQLAVTALTSLGLTATTASETSQQPGGVVIRQNPAAGVKVKPGSEVSLVVAAAAPGPAPTVIAQWVTDNIAKVSVDDATRPQQCLALAAAYRKIAQTIEDGDLTGGDAIIKRTTDDVMAIVGVSGDAWQKFLGDLADKLLNPMFKAGKLKTDAQHVKVWRDLAQGFEGASK